ncbi:DUF1353 domain-containing protein, partial [Lamprobacter modestohalophilus]|uniref:DUF1353 domain-containing protein n=1 Tax=Lamprobacter modestohalophilus TaxID=1064514 RepID=UPI002ADED9D5
LVYRDTSLGTLTVQPGALTDGASIPRLLWTLVGSPMRDWRVLRAAILHDQLYRSLGVDGQLKRAECDAVFRQALIAAGVPAYKAWLYWSGVRIGGWVGWRRYAREPAQVKREVRLIDWQRPPDPSVNATSRPD